MKTQKYLKIELFVDNGCFIKSLIKFFLIIQLDFIGDQSFSGYKIELVIYIETLKLIFFLDFLFLYNLFAC